MERLPLTHLKDLVGDNYPILHEAGFSLEEIEDMHLPAILEEQTKKTKINGERLQRVKYPFCMDFDYHGGKYLIVVDKGVLTNYATVPLIFQLVIRPTDKYIKQQSIIHDALVNEYGTLDSPNRLSNNILLINRDTQEISYQVDPAFADIIFRELILDGVRYNWKLKSYKAKAKAAICYAAVTAWRVTKAFIRKL